MVTIIYKPSSKTISSSNSLYIYDFGYIKGFLINDDFKLYKIIKKELRDNILYEECEEHDTNIPLNTLSIDKYEYIEEDSIIYTKNYSIEFSYSNEFSHSNEFSYSNEFSHSNEFSYSNEFSSTGIFDETLLKQLHNSNEIIKQNPIALQHVHSKMIPLSHLTVRQQILNR